MRLDRAEQPTRRMSLARDGASAHPTLARFHSRSAVTNRHWWLHCRRMWRRIILHGHLCGRRVALGCMVILRHLTWVVERRCARVANGGGVTASTLDGRGAIEFDAWNGLTPALAG